MINDEIWKHNTPLRFFVHRLGILPTDYIAEKDAWYHISMHTVGAICAFLVVLSICVSLMDRKGQLFQQAIFGGVGNPLCTIDGSNGNGNNILECDDCDCNVMKKERERCSLLEMDVFCIHDSILFVILAHPYTFLTPPYGVLKEAYGFFPRPCTRSLWIET